MAMKRLNFLFAALSVAAVATAGDELDAKLAALKTRTQRNVYSTAATLDNQDLVVPKGPTDEEQELDAKIRAMEKELDSDSAVLRQTAGPRRVTLLPQPSEENKNWLTPSLLDDAGSRTSPFDEEESSWITEELTRLENARLGKETQADEQKRIDQGLQESIGPADAMQYDPLQSYTESLQSFISGYTPTKEEPISPLQNFQRQPRLFQTSESDLYRTDLQQTSTFGTQSSFSTTTESPLQQSRFSFPRRQSEEFSFGNTPSKTPKFKSSWDVLNTDSFPPIRKKFQTSPLLSSDPFEDDFMGKPKKSIWDD